LYSYHATLIIIYFIFVNQSIEILVWLHFFANQTCLIFTCAIFTNHSVLTSVLVLFVICYVFQNTYRAMILQESEKVTAQ